LRRRHSAIAFTGSVHFITTVTALRGSWFIEPEICAEVLKLFEGYRAKHNLTCFGYVLMPDHLHALLMQPEQGNVVSAAIGGFKQMVSIKLRPSTYPVGPFWREGFDDVPVPGRDAAMTKLEYMHHNPIRRGLVDRGEDYLWSSAPFYYKETSSIVKLKRFCFRRGIAKP
jgi:putative transposase